MMRILAKISIAGTIAGATVLGGCSTGPANPFLTERSVFASPYVDPEIDKTGVGPDCPSDRLSTEGCWIDGLFYPGRGHYALDRNGNRVRLTKSERRALQARFETVQARIDVLEALESGQPLPPNSPALPSNTPSVPPPAPPPPAPPQIQSGQSPD